MLFPSARDLSDPGIEPLSPALGRGFFTTEPPLTENNNLAIKSKHKVSFLTTVPSFHVAAISHACYTVAVKIPEFLLHGHQAIKFLFPLFMLLYSLKSLLILPEHKAYFP